MLAMDRPWIDAGLKYAVVRDEDVPCLLVQRVARLRGSPTLCQRYLGFVVGSPALTTYVRAVQTGTAVPHISGGQIADFCFWMPPRDEQGRIASVLGAFDEKIDSNRRLAGLLEKTVATLFRARFVDFVGVEEFDDSKIGRIPRGWRVGVLADLARLRYGKALPARARRPGPVAVVGSSGVVGTHSAPLVSGPVVVVGRKGTAGSVVWIGRDAWPIDTTFFAVPADGLDPVFLYFALRHADLPHLTADSAVPGLNREAAEQRLVGVPPEEEVAEFAAVARPLFRHRDAMDGESQTLAGLRDALLPKLISGQIRVPDTRDPAEVIEPAAEAFQAAAS